MSAVFHVDLSRSGSGYAGSDLDPFSWADVKNWLVTASTSGTGTGTFDGTNAFTSNGFDVEFRMRGTGEVFGQTGRIDIGLVNFTSGQKIVFTNDDPAKYGSPVLLSDSTANALVANSSFLSVSQCNNLTFEFRNCILDISSVNACNILDFNQHHSLKVKFHNNVVLLRREATRLVRIDNASMSSAAACGFNTVMVNANSAMTLPMFSFLGSDSSESVSAYFGANYIANHNNTTIDISVVETSAFSILHYGGNRYGGNPNRINRYIGTGAKSSTGYADNILDYATQGVENDILFGGSETYSARRTSVFWPTNAGLLLNACPGHDTTLAYTLGVGAQDMRGFERQGYDAGAFEKSHVPTKQTWHVDLAAVGISEATGQVNDPMTLTDMLNVYRRLAPVVDDIHFILRNNNTSYSAIPDFNLGPLSKNTTAQDRNFGGTGSITISGYRTHVLTPPVLKVNRITASNACRVVIEKLKLSWTSGQDFITNDASVNNTGSVFILRNSVIQSESAVSQSIADSGNAGPDFGIYGNVFNIQHTTGLNGGIFILGSGNNTIGLNTIITPGVGAIGVVGSGSTEFVGNYINGVTSWNFAGASLAHNTQGTESVQNVFEDPTSNLVLSSWKFTGVVTKPLDILSVSDAPQKLRTECSKDMRDLVRDATPFGAPLYDAGPYEYSYFVPQTQYRYVDFARSGTGHAGTVNDRWSYLDMRTYLMGLNGTDTELAGPVEINCINSTNNAASIVLKGIEAVPTGSIRIRSENPFSLAYVESPDSSSWLDVSDSYGLILELDSVITKTSGYLPTISLHGEGFGSSIRAFNSVFWHKDICCLVVNTTSISNGSSITVAGVTKTVGVAPGNIIPATSVNAYAQNITNAFNADTGFAVAGCRAILVAPGVVGFTSQFSSITIITNIGSAVSVKDASQAGACVRVGSSWNFASVGCGFANIVDPGAQARVVSGIEYASGSTGIVGYSGFSGTSGADTGVFGNSSVLCDHNVAYGYTAGFAGVVGSGNSLSMSKIFQSISSESVVITDFTPVGAALNIVHESDLDEAVAAFGIDYDALRSLRSQTALGGTDYYDAGPVEASAITSTAGYLGNSDTVIAGITAEGYSLNVRRDIDGLGFRIVGYALGSSGYLMYDPKRVLGFAGSGSQAYGSVIVTSNTFGSSDQIAVGFGSTTITKQHNTVGGWQAGIDVAATCKNIANSFRNDPVFNAYCYCVVADNVVFFYSKLFGTVGNGFDLNSTFGTVSGFANGQTGLGVLNKVWPETSPYASFDRVENPDPTSLSLVVRLDFDECNKPIGQLAVIAEITSSSIPEEVGTLHVYAFANTPLHAKHNRAVLVKRIIMQF